MHLAQRVALGHFLVNDAAPGGHPLDVARANGAAIAQTIPVFNRACQDIGNGLDAAMRVPGKAGEVILRNIISEIIQQQERVELGSVAETKSSAQTHSGAFQRRLGLNQSFDRPY
jgi:hypothetical protein